MDRLRCIEVFLTVAQCGSFSAAASRLGIAKSSVTKHVRQLEADTGAQLFIRTTQRIALTDAGQVLREHGEALLERAEQLNEAVRTTALGEAGTLRIGVPPSFGARVLGPAIVSFAQQHPDVEVSLGYDYGTSDLVREGFDVSIRIAPALKDSTFVAHLLGRARQVLVASPRYLDLRGRPRTVAELKQHNCLIHALKTPTAHWELDGPQGRESIQVRGNYRSDFGDAIRVAALANHGIAMHLLYMVREDLESGRLEQVLPDHHPPTLGIFALVPAGRKMPRRVRILTGFLGDWFSRSDGARELGA
jgi:DNA-binding transcriptional LysR family regulator